MNTALANAFVASCRAFFANDPENLKKFTSLYWNAVKDQNLKSLEQKVETASKLYVFIEPFSQQLKQMVLDLFPFFKPQQHQQKEQPKEVTTTTIINPSQPQKEVPNIPQQEKEEKPIKEVVTDAKLSKEATTEVVDLTKENQTTSIKEVTNTSETTTTTPKTNEIIEEVEVIEDKGDEEEGEEVEIYVNTKDFIEKLLNTSQLLKQQEKTINALREELKRSREFATTTTLHEKQKESTPKAKRQKLEYCVHPKTNRKCIVFDFNGVLIFRNDQFSPQQGLIRPHAKEFLEKLSKYFDIGFWSSMQFNNLYAFVKRIANPKVFKPIFIFDQSKCTAVGIQGKEKPLFIKNISTIEKHFPLIHTTNILLVDDTADKIPAEQRRNLLQLPSWSGEENDDLLNPNGYFISRLIQLANSPLNVLQFLKEEEQQPFTHP